jgi:hypothetical protein
MPVVCAKPGNVTEVPHSLQRITMIIPDPESVQRIVVSAIFVDL